MDDSSSGQHEHLPHSVRRLTVAALDEMEREGAGWTDDVRQRLSAAGVSDADILAERANFSVSTRGKKRWAEQRNFEVPGNSYVRLSNPLGTMSVGGAGWPDPVDVRGAFPNGQVLGPASRRTPCPGWNRFCMLIKINHLVLYNSRIPHWGASVGIPGIYWRISVNEGGKCFTAFNDDWDEDNGGGLSQILTFSSTLEFARSMRPIVEGMAARGELLSDDEA